MNESLFSALGQSTTSRIAIERDAADPHFLANLNKLGPVRVDHHMQAIRPVSGCQSLLPPRVFLTAFFFSSRRRRTRNSSLKAANRLRTRGGCQTG